MFSKLDKSLSSHKCNKINIRFDNIDQGTIVAVQWEGVGEVVLSRTSAMSSLKIRMSKPTQLSPTHSHITTQNWLNRRYNRESFVTGDLRETNTDS